MKLNYTPWGQPQTIKGITAGLFWVDTASHGGLFVSDELLAQMPPCLREFKPFTGMQNWFEEDCDWMVPVLGLPHLFTPEQVNAALDAFASMASYHNISATEYFATPAGGRANEIAEKLTTANQ